jgi:hypothetical protein
LSRSYRLDDAASPPANRYIDAYPRVWKTLPTFDLNDLRLLAEVVEDDVAQPQDAAMLGLLASIGIGKGKPFAPDAERSRLLTAGVREAAAFMQNRFVNDAFTPFWRTRHWRATKSENNFGYSFHGNGKLDYDRRAFGFSYWATWAPKRLSDPGKLPASYYLKAFRDTSGATFRGDRQYRLRPPADTSAQDFWSIVAYELGTNAFIHNPQNRVGVSSYDKKQMRVNADGSVDVYIGPKAPKGLEKNWIPTAGKNFWLIARFYGPEKRLFEKTWVMPDVQQVR